jgi:hypothetical protein
MKRVIQVIFILACVLALGLVLFYFLRNNAESIQASVPVARRLAVVQTDVSGGQQDSSLPRIPDAKIPPEQDEVVLDAIDLNLDSNEELEQVIVVRSARVLNSKVSIVIADFQPATGNYYRLWKGQTLASKPNAFVIQPRDLFGNGEIELLCFGLDEQNRQTLTIFARTHGKGPAYKTIFSEAGQNIVVSDISGEGVATSGSAHQSKIQYPEISVYVTASGAQSPFDQTRIFYRWDIRNERYMKIGEEFVPGTNIESQAMANILTGSVSDFETYLNGLWVQSPSDNRGDTSVYFDTTNKHILLFSPSTQEEWDWESSSPGSTGILASSHDSTIPQLLRLFDIRLIGQDRIQLRVIDQQSIRFQVDEGWNGVYERKKGMEDTSNSKMKIGPVSFDSVSHSIAAKLSTTGANSLLRIEDLNGFYTSDTGVKLKIVQGAFTLVEGKNHLRGYADIFSVESTPVLDLSLINHADIPSGRKTYIVSILSRQNGRPSRISLAPARVETDHVEPLYIPSLFFTRSDH